MVLSTLSLTTLGLFAVAAASRSALWMLFLMLPAVLVLSSTFVPLVVSAAAFIITKTYKNITRVVSYVVSTFHVPLFAIAIAFLSRSILMLAFAVLVVAAQCIWGIAVQTSELSYSYFLTEEEYEYEFDDQQHVSILSFFVELFTGAAAATADWAIQCYVALIQFLLLRWGWPNINFAQPPLILVLDMDECLLHTQFLDDPEEAARCATQVRNMRQEFDYDGTQPVDSYIIRRPTGDRVRVFVRPGLKSFLLWAKTRGYETYIFTASKERSYAVPVLDGLEAFVGEGPLFADRFYRQHCTYDEDLGAYVKDLSQLPISLPLHQTVLVDNNPVSFYANPENGILVNNFYQDPRDNTLEAVQDLLLQLEVFQDVRPVLSERFQLKAALEADCPFMEEQATVMQFADSFELDTTTEAEEDVTADSSRIEPRRSPRLAEFPRHSYVGMA